MRIIAGRFRGRALQGPGGGRGRGQAPIRPTADRAREALFSIIGSEVEGARVLDLFAGSGALGLEALSRGARQAVFVENGQAALELIRRNIDLCGCGEQAEVVRGDLANNAEKLCQRLGGKPFDLILLDPPYDRGLAPLLLKAIAASGCLAEDGLLVAEERATGRLPERTGILCLVDQRTYGDTGFWFYRRL